MTTQTKNFDDVMQLFGINANDLFGKSDADILRTKYTDLSSIYTEIENTTIISIDIELKRIINSLPSGVDQTKFNTLTNELYKLQVYIFLTNCDKIRKDLQNALDNTNSLQNDLTNKKTDYDNAIKFINDLTDNLNKKFKILNDVTFKEIQKGGHAKKNYYNKYLKYKIKYLSLKNSHKK